MLAEVGVVVAPEVEDELQVHLEEAGDVLRALDVAAHPVKGMGHAREHHVRLGPRRGGLRCGGMAWRVGAGINPRPGPRCPLSRHPATS